MKSNSPTDIVAFWSSFIAPLHRPSVLPAQRHRHTWLCYLFWLVKALFSVSMFKCKLTVYDYRMDPFMMLNGHLTAASSLWWQASCQPRLCCLMPSASLCLTLVRDPTTSSSGTPRQAHCMHTSWCSAVSRTAYLARRCNIFSYSVLAERYSKEKLDQQQSWLAAAQGRFLALCGFGNLPGDITFLDKKADGKCKVISQVRCGISIAELSTV